MPTKLLVPSLALLAASPVLGATEGPGVELRLKAGRLKAPLTLDGRVDEPAWAEAPVFSDFQQSFPKLGEPPTERTELRILYDERFLWVSFVCFDSQPQGIVASLGRRDDPPKSDSVSVIVDSRLDHRSAFGFAVNAGGVLLDGVISEDSHFTNTWDAVWDARVARDDRGWSAEFRIPLHLLSTGATTSTWGFHARREIPRTHEELDTVVMPRQSNAFVSRFAHLEGVERKDELALEWLPFVASRLLITPANDEQPEVRVLRPSADIGLDVKAQLTPELQLNAAINPDFGQLEADQVLQNLSNTELFFPERRPFFTQGLDVFLPVGAQGGRSPHTLFYSRRIGLNTPIFLAGKVTGSLGSTSIGLLDAVVATPWSPPLPDGTRSRAARIYPARPLHLGLDEELPEEWAPTTNYFAGVARHRPTSTTAFGTTVTSEMPVESCAPAQPDCDPASGHAAAFDWHVSSTDRSWNWLGQVAGSLVTGPRERVLRDGTRLDAFSSGWGFYSRFGKTGGEPFRFRVDLEFATPTLELNRTGYLQSQNFARAQAWVGYASTELTGLLKELYVTTGTGHNVSTDGRGLYRGGGAWLEAQALLKSFDFVGCTVGFDPERLDPREIPEAGLGFGRPGGPWAACFFETDSARRVTLGANLVVGGHLPYGPFPGGVGYGASLSSRLQLHPQVITDLNIDFDYTTHGPRYVDTLEPTLHRFGNLDSRFLSLRLRQQFIVTPRLSIQAYAQLFADATSTVDFFDARPTGTRIVGPDLVAVAAPEEISRSSVLNLNVVLRWEYRLGSTLFLVYARSQEGLPSQDKVGVAALWPERLFAGPATDSLMVKWSYWWG